MPYQYTVKMPATSITAAETLVQYKAGAGNVARVVSAFVGQITQTATEFNRPYLLRKSAAATVTSFTPLLWATKDPAALGVGSTSGTGYAASAEGTDGDILWPDNWNLIAGDWIWNDNGQGGGLWVPASGIIAVKLMAAPAAARTMEASLVIVEYQG